jgi:hypothetical protein
MFDFDDDVRPRTFNPHTCVGGKESPDFSWWLNDGRGIPLCKVCSDCEEEHKGKYRPEIILGYYNENDVDEAIEPDDGGFFGEDW